MVLYGSCETPSSQKENAESMALSDSVKVGQAARRGFAVGAKPSLGTSSDIAVERGKIVEHLENLTNNWETNLSD
jgi:hypothetical protein